MDTGAAPISGCSAVGRWWMLLHLTRSTARSSDKLLSFIGSYWVMDEVSTQSASPAPAAMKMSLRNFTGKRGRGEERKTRVLQNTFPSHLLPRFWDANSSSFYSHVCPGGINTAQPCPILLHLHLRPITDYPTWGNATPAMALGWGTHTVRKHANAAPSAYLVLS